jgi:hypothetical protein
MRQPLQQSQFKAVEEFTEDEKKSAKELLDSLILKHTANGIR